MYAPSPTFAPNSRKTHVFNLEMGKSLEASTGDPAKCHSILATRDRPLSNSLLSGTERSTGEMASRFTFMQPQSTTQAGFARPNNHS